MAGFLQVKVNKDLIFSGAALYQPNVKGPMMTELKMFDEPFVSDTVGDWLESESNGSTISHSKVDGGAVIITCNASTGKDCGELSHNASWSAASAVGMEAKVKISQITSVGIAVGFVDAVTATNDLIAMEMNGTAMTNMTTTADACGMVFDTNATTDVWYCLAANNGTEGTPVAAVGSLAPVADTYFRVRVQTDTSGNVTLYYNGTAVGYLPAAIAYASTNLLTPYIGFISRSTANPVCTISRITVWQNN